MNIRGRLSNIRGRLSKLEKAQPDKAIKVVFGQEGAYYDKPPWEAGAQPITADELEALESTHFVVLFQYVHKDGLNV